MFNRLRALFGASRPSLSDLLQQGAIVVDVRTPQEYRTGHPKGSRNIPLASLSGQLSKLRKKQVPVVTCCASGMRSGKAAKVLQKAGIEAHNGGSWQAVERARTSP